MVITVELLLGFVVSVLRASIVLMAHTTFHPLTVVLVTPVP